MDQMALSMPLEGQAVIKVGDWIIVDEDKRKKCFGKTESGNYLIKMYNKLMQVPPNRVIKSDYGK